MMAAPALASASLASAPVRHAPRPMRMLVADVAPQGVSSTCQSQTSRRNLLAGVIGSTAFLLVAAPSACAKSIESAKRERDARKQAVRNAVVTSKEEGRSIDTGLSSDFSLPEDAQRGRNSRTVPQKHSD